MKPKHFWIAFIIICLGALCISSISHAQDTGKVSASAVYNDVKHGIEVNSPKLGKAITTIAKDLKVTADKVWDILVRQQLVHSLTILMGLIITIFSWVHFWYRYNQGNANNWISNKGHKVDSYGETYKGIAYEAACVITLVVAAVGSIVSGIYFYDMITGFINPEYGAMKTIASIAQSLK